MSYKIIKWSTSITCGQGLKLKSLDIGLDLRVLKGSNFSCTCNMNDSVLKSLEVGTSGSTGNENLMISEGRAEVILPQANKVFYNPVQEFNRDLSVAVLRVFTEDYRKKCGKKAESVGSDRTTESQFLGKQLPNGGQPCEGGITILEALSASGLRSIRYAKEVPGVKTIIANDISAKAVDSINTNIRHNKVENLVKTSHDDASMLMYAHRRPYTKRFDAVDLDPYGCPSQFLDAAVQSLADGGLLLVTATDMAILAGNAPETCYSKYGAISLRSRACHEMALRILLQCIESHANRYGRYIVPLLSVSADFYVRVFVKLFTGQAVCKKTTSKLSTVYQCTGCESYTLQPLGICRQVEKNIKFSIPTGPPVRETCSHCGHKHHVGGPIWAAPIHDGDFLNRLEEHLSREIEDVPYGTAERMRGLIALLKEELPDVPLYYAVDRLCSIIHAETMPMVALRSALLNAGYRVSLSHACRTSIKTDAPVAFIWHVMCAWESSHPVKRDRIVHGSPAYGILLKSSSGQSDSEMKTSYEFPPVNFDMHQDANPPSRRRGLLRFQENPLPNWGPGTKATAMTDSNRCPHKSQKNQGKRHQPNQDDNSRKLLKAE